MLAVALWTKLARKKSFWSPNTKPWRQMVTTSGILMRNKIEKGKRINKRVHISRVQCNGEELFAKNINWLNFCRIWHCQPIYVSFQAHTLLLSFALMLANMVENRLNCAIWCKYLKDNVWWHFLRLFHSAGVQPSRRPHRHWGWHTDTHGGQLSFGFTSTQGWGLCTQTHRNTDQYEYTQGHIHTHRRAHKEADT